MNKVFFFVMVVFLVAGCSGQESSISSGKKELKHSKNPPATEEKKTEAQRPVPAGGKVEEKKTDTQDAAGQGRANPFLTAEEEKREKSTKDRLFITNLDLSAIFYSPEARMAIINGSFFKEGDMVDNKRIVEINREEVILKDSRSVYVLQMKELR